MRRAAPAGTGALAGLVTFVLVGMWAGAWLGWFACCVVGLLTTHLVHLTRAAGTPAEPEPTAPPRPVHPGWRWDFEDTDRETAAGYPAHHPERNPAG